MLDSHLSVRLEVRHLPRIGKGGIRMNHRGLGMRILGRLAMAAALLVPVGIVAAGQAGAAGGGFNCHGAAGTVSASPGLLLSSSRPQTLGVSSTGLSCSGGFVTGGNLSASLQTPNVRCSGMVGKSGNGSGTLTWTAPANMGKSTAKLNFKVTGTVAHTTTGTITGTVTTSGSNLGSGKAISGSFTLNKGLKPTAQGGDCSVTSPITSFGITAIALKTNAA